MRPRPLDGRAVLVTGASRRIAIGAAIVRRLAADGARTAVHSWSPADAEQPWGADEGGVEALLDEVRAAGADAVHVPADFADPEAPATVVAAARRAFGHLDAVVAAHARSSARPLEELTAAELDLTYAVNVRAPLLLVRELAAQHDGRPGGRVVLFTSGQYHGAMADELPYVASKGALHQVVKSLAVHLAPRAIAVNAVDPGPTATGYAGRAREAGVARAHPRGRWGTPEDAARLVAWLVGDEADWVTGQVIASDGGWSARARA